MAAKVLEESDAALGSPLTIEAADSVDACWLNWAIWMFVGLGITVRLVRYLVNYPIWHDEAFVAVNLWDRGYTDLLRPLDYSQVCPWLFLWIELTAVKWLGYSEPALRFFPMLCGVASLAVFRHVAGRLCRGYALLVSVAVFATAFYPIRHGAEIKPYASDLLASLILLTMALEWWRAPGQSRWWWFQTATVPLLLGLSYPAVFVAGGISLALAPAVWRARHPRVTLSFVVYNIVMIASFVSMYMAFTVFQNAEVGSKYRWGYWLNSFPRLDRPWTIPSWLINMHTGNMMAYPIGGEHGASTGTFALVLVGCLALWRRNRGTLLAILLAPFGMGLLAAGLGRYPYGGTARTMQYLAPSICLLTGLGAAAFLARLPRPEVSRRACRWTVVLLGSLGCWLIGRDLACPYRVIGDVHTREFARRFWRDQEREAEVACVRSDLGLAFEPHEWKVGMSAVYLFHQRMFSSRARGRNRPDLRPERLAQGRPLRLVIFEHDPTENPLYRDWMKSMYRKFDLRRADLHVIHPGKPEEPWLRDGYLVLEFAPKSEPDLAARNSTGPVR